MMSTAMSSPWGPVATRSALLCPVAVGTSCSSRTVQPACLRRTRPGIADGVVASHAWSIGARMNMLAACAKKRETWAASASRGVGASLARWENREPTVGCDS